MTLPALPALLTSRWTHYAVLGVALAFVWVLYQGADARADKW